MKLLASKRMFEIDRKSKTKGQNGFVQPKWFFYFFLPDEDPF